MKIMISAAESSADIHGAALLKALRQVLGDESIDAFGMGGPALIKEGLRSTVESNGFMLMGFVEVMARIPEAIHLILKLRASVKAERPDVIVLIDYPDFHFALARALSLLKIPVVYYIPPKVWAWRKYRLEYLRKYFVSVMCVLPFEESFYKKNGLKAVYVGNPLMNELPFELTRAQARKQLTLSEDDCVLVLMPGSRRAEIHEHLLVMLGAARQSVRELRRQGRLGAQEPLHLVIPVVSGEGLTRVQKILDEQTWIKKSKQIKIRVLESSSAIGLVAADAALVKSGTSTLEAALLRCPHVIVYKPEAVNAFIFRHLVRYRGPAGLVNLILDEQLQTQASGPKGEAGNDPLRRVFRFHSTSKASQQRQTYGIPEVLYDQVNVHNLSHFVVRLLTDTDFKKSLHDVFDRLAKKMKPSSVGDQPFGLGPKLASSLTENLKNESPSICAARVLVNGVSSGWTQ